MFFGSVIEDFCLICVQQHRNMQFVWVCDQLCDEGTDRIIIECCVVIWPTLVSELDSSQIQKPAQSTSPLV